MYINENGVSLKTKCAMCQTNQWNFSLEEVMLTISLTTTQGHMCTCKI